MDRDYFYELMHGEGTTDYERYLNTKKLFSCQGDFGEFCNGDELQFQIVHQIQELLMKLIACTLLDIDEYIKDEKTNRIITLFQRVYRLQEVMIKLFDMLDTMSPKEYQEIRIKLGGGSGRESPGFRTLIKMGEHLWHTFEKHYLEKNNTSIEKIYNSEYSHSDTFMVAEALATYDELFQKFRFHHLKHVQRSIGLGAKSLKGHPVSLLKTGLEKTFFPELWQIRDTMTDQWTTRYGEVRESLRPDQ